MQLRSTVSFTEVLTLTVADPSFACPAIALSHSAERHFTAQYAFLPCSLKGQFGFLHTGGHFGIAAADVLRHVSAQNGRPHGVHVGTA